MKRLLLILFAVFILVSPVQGEFFKDIVVTSPTGIWTDSRAYTTLSAAITAIGASEQDLYIAKKEIVTTLVIPANIRLHFLKDGSIANSNTLTINTKNIHADHQIFTGAGAVNFASSTEVRTRWFEDFETAITQTSNDTVTLLVDTADTLANSAAVGDNVLLKWNASNLITIAAGQTLSNIGDIDAPGVRLFVVSGAIAFKDQSPLKEVRADWFGSTLATLDIADNAAAAARKLLVITPGAWVIDTNLTLSSNLKVLNSADLQIATNITLTISGNLDAGLNKIFSCTGTGKVVFGSRAVKQVYPEWWGDCTAADTSTILQAAFDCATNSTDVLTVKLTGTYKITSGILVDVKKTNIAGSGRIDATGMATGVAMTVLASGASGHLTNLAHLEGFALVGPGIASAVKGILLQDPAATDEVCNVLFQNVSVQYFLVGVEYDDQAFMVRHQNCLVWACGTGVLCSAATNGGENQNWFGGTVNACGVAVQSDNANGTIKFFGTSMDNNSALVAANLGAIEFHGVYVEANRAAVPYTSTPIVVGANQSSKFVWIGGEFTNVQTLAASSIDHMIDCSNPSDGVGVLLSGVRLVNTLTATKAMYTGVGHVLTRDLHYWLNGSENPYLHATTGNQLADGGFEANLYDACLISDSVLPLVSRTTGTNIQLALDTGEYHAGAKSLKVTKAGAAATVAQFEIAASVLPGTKIGTSFWWKKLAAAPAGTMYIYYQFAKRSYYSYNGGVAAEQGGIPAYGKTSAIYTATVTVDASSFDWTEVTLAPNPDTGRVPRWADTVRIYFVLTGLSAGDLYFDDFMISAY